MEHLRVVLFSLCESCGCYTTQEAVVFNIELI